MRDYVSGNWGFTMIWGFTGSVFPRAFAMAVPNAIVSFIFATIVHGGNLPESGNSDRAENCMKMLAAFSSVQFFVLFFRSNVAYSRWWEGGTLLQKTRGEWFNAYSSLIAFSSTSTDREMIRKVEEYQHLLARLMSMLFCAGLQQVSPNKQKCFEILDTRGIDPKSLEFLGEAQDKVEVLLQWIQRATVLNSANGVLPIAPPILSRAFQEISRGIVNLQNARKIADFPFPFPYAQMSMVMLLVHYIMTPFLAGMMVESVLAAGVSFLMVFFLWCINFIALQLEYPFGDRTNDLPMIQFQRDWNKSVATLLARRANQPPTFKFEPDIHRQFGLIMSDGSVSKKGRVTVIGNVRNSGIFSSTPSLRSRITSPRLSGGSIFSSRGVPYTSTDSHVIADRQESNKSVTLSMEPEVMDETRSDRHLPSVREHESAEELIGSGEYTSTCSDSLEVSASGSHGQRRDDPLELKSALSPRHDSRSLSNSSHAVVARHGEALERELISHPKPEVLPQPVHQSQPMQPGKNLETVALPQLLHLDDIRDGVAATASSTSVVRRLAVLRASNNQSRSGVAPLFTDSDRREEDRIPLDTTKLSLSM